MPSTKVQDAVSHRDVARGDTLWGICTHVLGDSRLVGDLARLNGIQPQSILRIGQRLIVPNYQRFDLTVNYMLAEMVRNATSPEAAAVADAITRSKQAKAKGDEAFEDMKKAPWYEFFRSMGDQQVFDAMLKQSGIAMVEAKARWAFLVRADGRWDHKPILRQMYERMSTPPRPFGALNRAYHFPIRGDVFHEFYYDVWSNIHFGYVGARCGFDERTLQEGAAAGLPGVGTNDEGDVISIKIGFDLWRSAGTKLTVGPLRDAILAQTGNYQAARAREISRGVSKDKATNVVITNNDYK